MINSSQDLGERLELVRWEVEAHKNFFDLTTIHSLLIDSNPKFKQLKEIVHNYNQERRPDRIRLQQAFVEGLFKRLSELTRIPIVENQLEYLQKIHKWATNGDKKQSESGDGASKTRPGTASTRTRPTTAYSRPQTGFSRPGTAKPVVARSNKTELETIVMNKEDPRIDYDKLKQGEQQFYAGIRTLHGQYEHPKKRLKDYQRKIFYEDQIDSDVEVIELDEKVEPNILKEVQISEEKLLEEIQGGQQQVQEGAQGADGAEGAEGADVGDVNVDDIPIEGEDQGGVVEVQQPKQIIDKLKPRIKAYCVPENVHINKHHYEGGMEELRIQKEYRQRRAEEDRQLAQLQSEWAQRKGRAKSEMKRRSQSARIVTKKIGVGFKKETLITASGSENVVNFQNMTPVQVNNKVSRPATAFNACNHKNRQQLIKNAFITGRLIGHVQKMPSTAQSVGGLTTYGEKPKKKTFQQILRQAEERVVREAEEEISCVKQTLAKEKISLGANRIAKSISYYDHQLPGEWGGAVVGMGMLKNPFIKVAKKKKKKKKK